MVISIIDVMLITMYGRLWRVSVSSLFSIVIGTLLIMSRRVRFAKYIMPFYEENLTISTMWRNVRRASIQAMASAPLPTLPQDARKLFDERKSTEQQHDRPRQPEYFDSGTVPPLPTLKSTSMRAPKPPVVEISESQNVPFVRTTIKTPSLSKQFYKHPESSQNATVDQRSPHLKPIPSMDPKRSNLLSTPSNLNMPPSVLFQEKNQYGTS